MDDSDEHLTESPVLCERRPYWQIYKSSYFGIASMLIILASVGVGFAAFAMIHLTMPRRVWLRGNRLFADKRFPEDGVAISSTRLELFCVQRMGNTIHRTLNIYYPTKGGRERCLQLPEMHFRNGGLEQIMMVHSANAVSNASKKSIDAYVAREYADCILAGQEALATHFVANIGLITIIAFRRLGQFDDAESLGREILLRCLDEDLIHLMRVLDDDLDPERFIRESAFDDSRKDYLDLKCRVYFYWGARLLTDHKFGESIEPLLLSLGTESDAAERGLAAADLKTAREQLATA